MNFPNLHVKVCLLTSFVFCGFIGSGQYVKNVPEAFAALHSNPEVIHIENVIDVPNEEGHFQGIQLIDIAGIEKLLISGSSFTQAYILQVDLTQRKTEKLITLMNAPYRHAGGIQVSTPFLLVGIEDNFTKTVSKVGLYSYLDANLHKAEPNSVIDRKGKVKRQTAGATGLLSFQDQYLAVVANWDSRNWDFYDVNPEKDEWELLKSFVAPDHWPSYQSINLIKDNNAIYAIGFYQKKTFGYADLILLSKLENFRPILEQIVTKKFLCANGADFSTAAGLQVDDNGKLHIWATQRDAAVQITVNRFSQK